MTKFMLITLGLTVSFTFLLASWVWAEEREQYSLETLFKDVDIVHDKRVDRGEFDIFHFLSFTLLDADKDGVLLIDECTGDCFQQRLWFDKNTKEKRVMADAIRELEFVSAPYRFDAIDVNGNGQLNLSEYVRFGRDRFQYFDQNKDGAISLVEFCAGYRSSMTCNSKYHADKEPSTGKK